MTISTGSNFSFHMEDSDGTWRDITNSISSFTITREEDLREKGTPIHLPRNIEFEIPIKWLYPTNPLDLMVIIYESSTGLTCPGSWRTKRLRKKRMKVLTIWSTVKRQRSIQWASDLLARRKQEKLYQP